MRRGGRLAGAPFVAEFVRQTKALRVGDGLDEQIQMGPSVNESQLATVMDYVKIGRQEGATLACFDAFAVLEERGYLERSPDTEKYRIGVRAFELGSIYIQTTSIEAEAQPVMRQLARECQQTANLGILSGFEVVHIAVVPPDRPIRFYTTVGQRDSAHCTGLGKALLAHLRPEELAELAGDLPFPRRTARCRPGCGSWWER